jgi:hypothetical protein
MPPHLPDALESLLTSAVGAVCSHPHHDLTIGYRRTIYHRLGVKRSAPDQLLTRGHQRRTALAIATVEYVLPLWEHLYPSDFRPHRLLTTARGILQGESYDWESIKDDMFDMFYADQRGDEIGLAATWAFDVARFDNEFTLDAIDTTLIDATLNDHQLRGSEHDTAFFASIAFTDGPWWIAQSNPTKRREFWMWWLGTAVPTAWEAIR